VSKTTPSIQLTLPRLRRWLGKRLLGGEWVLTLPSARRWNLGWFSSDSLFASASENIVITYLSIYLLALGATGAQIGAWSSLSGLVGAGMLLLGAALVERIGHRQKIVVFAGGWMARLSLLTIVLLPLLLKGETLILVLIGLAVARDSFNNLGSPAWTSLVGDIVPIDRRGIFFGSRNFIMGAAGMISVLIVGELVTRIGSPLGYQVSMGLAFGIGMIATYSYSHIRDPHPQPPEKIYSAEAKVSLSVTLRDIAHHPGFLTFTLVAALWNFSLNIAGPFFNVFMVRVLNITPGLIAINSVVYAITSMLAQLVIGRWADRIGARRIQFISGLLIPIMPFCWLFLHNGWQVIPINIFSGALWGVYGLASFNLMLELTPAAQRARYSAIYQLVVMISLAVGAAVGGVMITNWGFRSVFITSGIGRFTGAILFAWLVHAPKPQPGAAQIQV
jgi:MFS family permease